MQTAMLHTNLFSRGPGPDPADKLAPVDAIAITKRVALAPAHVATDSMDLETVDLPFPAPVSSDYTSTPASTTTTSTTTSTTTTGNVTPADSVDVHGDDPKPSLPLIVEPADVDGAMVERPLPTPSNDEPSAVTEFGLSSPQPAPGRTQTSIRSIDPQTSSVSESMGRSYLTSFPAMIKADTRLLMHELRRLRDKPHASGRARLDASDRQSRGRSLRDIIPLSVSRTSRDLGRSSASIGNGNGNGEGNIESESAVAHRGSKKRPQAQKKRRSSSVKRMSSVFGDWQVTNILQAGGSVAVDPHEAVDAGDQVEYEGPSCELPGLATNATRLVSLDTVSEIDPPPTDRELEELYDMEVLDQLREKVKFGSLVKDAKHERVVVVFIRHFFCGNCFGYVRALANEMPVSRLETFGPSTKVIIIGCGDPILVPNYIKMTGCEFEIYADPARRLYARLGFSVNTLPLDPDNLPTYVSRYSPTSLVRNILVSLGLAVRAKSIAAGKPSQNGGELIWTGGELVYTHRMKHPGDHIEIEELERLLGAR